MQISENLPQFKDEKVLIIVSSTQSADIYKAGDAEIEKITEIRTEKPEHDDQAGRFERSGHGKTFGTGTAAGEANNEKKIKDRFNNNLKNALKDITENNFTSLILISSPQDKKQTKEQLPTALQKILNVEITGNHVGEHPDDILKKIQGE